MATFGADIVNFALKKAGILGVGRAASATDSSDALADLNDMLSEWAQQRWMNWSLLDVGFVSTGGTGGYTVGPAGNYAVTPRPNRIEAAYVRQLVNSGLPVDTPLRVIEAREEFSRLALKTLVSFPRYVFLDTVFPTATLNIYPWPSAAIYEVHIILKNTQPIIALATNLSAIVPAHYLPAMKFNLARRLRQAYGKGMKPDEELNRLAKNALDVVKQSNLQIPELVMPAALVAGGGSGYNIYSDSFGR
jgi:hypothetical protein